MDTSNFKEVFTSDEVKKLRSENEMLHYEAQRLDSLATDFAKRTEYWIGRCDSWQNDCEQLRKRVQELENVAELKRDSERYIWLISQEAWEPPRDALPKWYGGKIKWLGGDYSIDEINEIIDEARKHEHTNPAL